MDIIKADAELQPHITGITTGRDAGLERQLFQKSRQPNILKYTPKDAATRFGSKEMFDAWQAGGREIYWLLGKDSDLAGIIWYGKKQPPAPMPGPVQPSETFAIRLYDGYSGHGLAVPAMRQTLRMHAAAAQARGEPLTGIWLETDTDNPAALKVYGRFGYEEVGRTPERVTMVLPAGKIAAAIAG